MSGQDAFDLIVIGAGTAGAACAYHAAKAGLRTCLVERNARDEAGARWVNAVPDWTFEAAGLERPAGPERLAYDVPFHLNIGYGEACATIRGHGLYEVDMRRLGQRLVGLAESAGASVRDETRVLHVDGSAVHTETGTLRGRYVVDASGLSGVRLFGPPSGIELCVAAQEIRHVTDMSAARAFFIERGVRVGDVIGFTAVEGGFSVVNVRLEHDAISILTGSLAGGAHRSGRQLLDAFVADHPFVGARIFGGARAIPIGRPRDTLVHGQHAVLGDAAVQVFPAHGSGIGIGLIAGRWLAESVAKHGALEPYAIRFQRELGGLCAGYEAMRRFTSSATREELAYLLGEGLLTADMLGRGLSQRMPTKDPRLVPTFARLARKRPALGARLLSAVGRLFALHGLYAAYPKEPARRVAWAHAARLLADQALPRLAPWVLTSR